METLYPVILWRDTVQWLVVNIWQCNEQYYIGTIVIHTGQLCTTLYITDRHSGSVYLLVVVLQCTIRWCCRYLSCSPSVVATPSL